MKVLLFLFKLLVCIDNWINKDGFYKKYVVLFLILIIIVQKMRNYHIYIICLSIITLLISLYFGASIHNAQDNFLTEHLNEQDGFNFESVDDVPILTKKAALLTSFFLILSLGLQVFVFFKTPYKKSKRIALALMVPHLIILFYAFLLMTSPQNHNFGSYGMIWVTLSLLIVFGNIISIFIKK